MRAMLKTHTICLSISLTVFLIDSNITLGVAVGVPYILVVFLALKDYDQKLIYIYSILASLLTILGYLISPKGGEFWKVITNRGLALFAIWITAFVCNRLIKSIHDLKVRSKVLEQSPNAIIISDKNGTIQYINEAFTKITGFSHKEAIGANPRILNSGKNPPELYKEMWQSLTSNKSWQGDLINRRKSGEEVWIHLTISPILDSKGNATHYISTEQDMTKIRSSESALVKSERRLRDLVEATPMCIHEIDKNGKLCSMNSTGLEMMGVKEEKDVIGLDYCSLPNKNRQNDIKQMMKEAFEGKTSFFEFSILNDQKEEIFFESCFRPIIDNDGNIEKLMGVSKNITERKRAEFLTEKALEDSNESNRVKEEFLSIVSHELRTPMNGIFGGLEIIKDDIDEKSFEILYCSSVRMMSTIDDILNFISLSKKNVTLNLYPFMLSDLKEDLTKRIHKISILDDKNLNLNIDWQGWTGKFMSDFTLIENIIWNILSNSLKFTSKGNITLTTTLNSEELTIDIIDTGCGIDKKRQKFIFEEFKQADSSISRNHQGLGMGLAISLKQTKLLDGNLELVSSSINQGSHFKIKIPASKQIN